MTSQPISVTQLALAATLMSVSIILSWRLRLGLSRDIIVSACRMTVQLLLVGLILGWVFSLKNPWPVIGIGLVMTALAAQAAASRPALRYPQILLDAFLSILVSAFLLTGVVLGGILQVDPWFLPQYAIPILGMVLGNSLTGVSLAVDRFTADLVTARGEIESLLALGASRWEAAHDSFSGAMRTGMVPTLNSMAIMGIVSLPGMMTGQILGGADPHTAVRYQILIMFVIATTSALAMLLVLFLAYRRLFDANHRLRIDLLEPPRR